MPSLSRSVFLSAAVNRRTRFLLVLLGLSVAFTSWQWLRPYEWSPDPGAHYRIEFATVKEDHDFYWVDLQLKRHGDVDHDFLKPAYLITASGRQLEAADFQTAGDEQHGLATLTFRFWLEKADLSGPLKLRLDDGTLTVRDGSGAPLSEGASHSYYTCHW